MSESEVHVASERRERATRPERAGAAASEGACSRGEAPGSEMQHVNQAHVASERSERATRPERAGAAASEGACRGVRGAKPLGEK